MIYSIIIALVISIVIGFGLCLADHFFNKDKNEKEEQIRDNLPGANCGACGFSGCNEYAAALIKDNSVPCNLCVPGGNDVAKELANILGKEELESVKKTAKVLCSGCSQKSHDELIYTGEQSCKMAKQLYGGYKMCKSACLGFGDCVKECENNAITVNENLAYINPLNCTACGKCVKVCPNNIIEIFELKEKTAVVNCSNTKKGAETRKACDTGCIGCKKCEKNCPAGAITVENNLAKIDTEKCSGCGICIENCPVKVISFIN